MQAGSKKLLLASSVDGKELLFLSHRRTCKRKQLRLFLEVTGSIHLVIFNAIWPLLNHYSIAKLHYWVRGNEESLTLTFPGENYPGEWAVFSNNNMYIFSFAKRDQEAYHTPRWPTQSCIDCLALVIAWKGLTCAPMKCTFLDQNRLRTDKKIWFFIASF